MKILGDTMNFENKEKKEEGQKFHDTPDFSGLEIDSAGNYSEDDDGFKIVTAVYGRGDFSQTLIVCDSIIFYVYKNLGDWPDTKPEPIFEYKLYGEVNLGGEESQKFKSEITFLPGEPGPRIRILENVWNMNEWNIARELRLNSKGYYSIHADDFR